MNVIGISSQIACPLSGRHRCTDVVVMMLMQGVERLGIGIRNEVVKMLGLTQSWMLRTSRGVMMGSEGWWEIRGLEVRSGGQRCTAVMGHSSTVPISPVTMVMGTRVRGGISPSKRRDTTMARQPVLKQKNG